MTEPQFNALKIGDKLTYRSRKGLIEMIVTERKEDELGVWINCENKEKNLMYCCYFNGAYLLSPGEVTG